MTADVRAGQPASAESRAAGPETVVRLGPHLRRLAAPWRGRLALVGALVLLAAVLELVPPLVVGHVIDRDQAKQLGWSDDKIISRANTQPEHVRGSVSSGGKHVREQAAAAPGYGGHSGVGLPLVLDMPLCTSRE